MLSDNSIFLKKRVKSVRNGKMWLIFQISGILYDLSSVPAAASAALMNQIDRYPWWIGCRPIHHGLTWPILHLSVSQQRALCAQHEHYSFIVTAAYLPGNTLTTIIVYTHTQIKGLGHNQTYEYACLFFCLFYVFIYIIEVVYRFIVVYLSSSNIFALNLVDNNYKSFYFL